MKMNLLIRFKFEKRKKSLILLKFKKSKSQYNKKKFHIFILKNDQGYLRVLFTVTHYFRNHYHRSVESNFDLIQCTS